MNHQNPYDLPEIPKFTREQAEWRDRAACKGMDVEIFFPTRGDSEGKTRRAREICNTCSVKTECLNYSLEFSERYLLGIWGGRTHNERRVFNRNYGRQLDAPRSV